MKSVCLSIPYQSSSFFTFFWMLIASINSKIPLVSFKFLLSKIWFVIPSYFLMVLVFKKEANLRLFSYCYISSLLIVVFYTIIRHAQYGFSEEAGHWVMTPFFNDHTAYGAMLAFFIPFLFLLSRYRENSKLKQVFIHRYWFVIYHRSYFIFQQGSMVKLGSCYNLWFINCTQSKIQMVGTASNNNN